MVRISSYLAAALVLASLFAFAMGVRVVRSEAAAQTESARTFTVAHPAEYPSSATNLKPGDTVILRNGVWRDFDLRFEGEGTAEAPIRLRAETPGRVILSGRSRLSMSGQHLDVSGLVFRDGYAPQDEVIAFRIGNRVANDSRVSYTVIDGYNRPREDVTGNDSWVALFGRRNRFDHNHIVGKTTPGVTLAVRIETEADRPNHHRIDHNYFGPRPPLGANGGETIRIGTSHNSLFDSATLIEANYFEECSGEVEIISVKSGANIIRGNLFHRSQGSVTLRHGNGNLVEDNVFMGGGQDNTGGVRVINSRQIVRNNLFIDLTGTGFTSALAVMNGVPDSPLNRYHQVRDAEIHNNTFVNVAHLAFGVGADAERSLPPADSGFRNNLIVGQGTQIERLSDLSGMVFAGNVTGEKLEFPIPGFTQADVDGRTSGPGTPAFAATAAGAPRDLKRLSRAEAGVSWYGQPQSSPPVRLVNVSDAAALVSIISTARSETMIALAPGSYDIGSVEVSHALTLNGPARVNGRFVLSGEADLSLNDLSLSGSGPLILATPSRGHAYRLQLNIVGVANNDGPVVAAEDGAFLRSITLTQSRFSDLSAPVLDLGGAAALKGAYKAETVTIDSSHFARLSTPVLLLVRGGRDESTFGPRVVLSGNHFDRVTEPAHLHGATSVHLSDNRFSGSGPIRLLREAGAPDVTIDGQRFTASATEKHFEYIDIN